MENVPQVHSQAFVADFEKWIDYLSSIGYVSFWKDLNSKNFKIPQNRERCFMVSILDKDAYFHFPSSMQLSLRLGNVLEKNVPESYYLSPDSNDESVSPCLTARGGGEEHSGMVLFSEIARTIRVSGRGSLDGKHTWDIVIEQGKTIEKSIDIPHGRHWNGYELAQSYNGGKE